MILQADPDTAGAGGLAGLALDASDESTPRVRCHRRSLEMRRAWFQCFPRYGRFSFSRSGDSAFIPIPRSSVCCVLDALKPAGDSLGRSKVSKIARHLDAMTQLDGHDLRREVAEVLECRMFVA